MPGTLARALAGAPHRSRPGSIARSVAAAGLVAGLAVATARAEPMHIFAAGSLSAAVPELLAASGLPADAVAPPVFGPAGLLRQRIAAGEHADLFLSADLAQPKRLADAGLAAPPVAFARNRMCVVARTSLHLTAQNLVDRLLDPAVRLATSTVGADPGGDYATAVFARADSLHPGARATLEAKALQLFGGPTTMVPTGGHTPAGAVLLADKADAVLYYCSSAAAVVSEVPDTAALPLPPSLEVSPVYGLTVIGNNPDAQRLALFMLSTPGQTILVRYGLLPVLARQSAGALLTVIGPSNRAVVLSMADLRARAATTVTLAGEQGVAIHLSGPALWTLLQDAGAIGPDLHDHVRQVLTATGSDGYSATIALGEIDPAFEGKPALIATTRNGTPLNAPRLTIAGDKRLGRNVRDVVSLTVR